MNAKQAEKLVREAREKARTKGEWVEYSTGPLSTPLSAKVAVRVVAAGRKIRVFSTNGMWVSKAKLV